MKKKVSILGSTGSIGTQTLDVIRNNMDHFDVVGLAVMNNIEALEIQIHEFKPKIVAVFNEEKAAVLRSKVTSSVKVVSSINGLIEVATYDEVELLLNSVVGSIGVLPTLKAIECGIDIALANKETLVVAGKLVMEKAKKNNVKIIPVDSEHSAIFQCLVGEDKKTLSKILLTASGGPFREWQYEQINKATYKEALKHPNWSMGKKISIDSATLMNKGLEAIEAKWLFDIDMERIEVVIHPQSIIHSMVEFNDTSIIAQLGLPDMRIAIQYALTYPNRLQSHIQPLDFSKLSTLTFEQPDIKKFPCLKLCFDSIKIGGTMPCVLNAANEELVNLYLQEKINFYDISSYIQEIMNVHSTFEYNSVEELIEVDNWSRKWIIDNYKR
ncbi:1-deoxy-D-xylulose-5-phosphate reductoisomerase [Serpentinicella sp. ANB-PHB4]|uniref:1-deoxy-D-xylulose-5-phosphate reductoisomerase n=1 Tax=Serpentinicella sp. ANB-PHB4 TaxID=3074076 RepID=UPI002860785C|nr:1-deoxy-D-xylulose-5-phosphate reductoisomerase [Serpentinicella sp. ANB-PHB4]MDR5658229.1 1-deoxy-D-xylulose-5-phosphate reductoisomerase [Serpentinicella sp. ANB-PHB4]